MEGIIEFKDDKLRIYMNARGERTRPAGTKDHSTLSIATFKKGGKIPKDAKPMKIPKFDKNIDEPEAEIIEEDIIEIEEPEEIKKSE